MAKNKPKNENLPLENPDIDKLSSVENSQSLSTNRKSKSAKSKASNTDSKLWILFIVLGVLGFAGGIAMILIAVLTPADTDEIDSVEVVEEEEVATNIYYSRLTGLPLQSENDITAPAYCIQTPNGTDGARPQAGLDQAGVVFEAIAESGITRFAAIYQNPTSAIIGPIRSLRMYYLEWDVPFDCTIVHAGGAPDALAAVTKYKDLTENYSYMYRSSVGARLWNNLFTTSSYLAQFSKDRGYNTSDIKGFTRMTPEEALIEYVDNNVVEKLVITEAAKGDTSKLVATVPNIAINFGGLPNFNVRYEYDADTNSYKRSYESGAPHEVYSCPEGDLGEKSPENTCTLKQLSPSTVVAIMVNEKRASDNYHEDITVIGSGDAYIFQNGTAITGKWTKKSDDSQIVFTDKNGEEVKLAPGQTFIEAVPTYGSVRY